MKKVLLGICAALIILASALAVSWSNRPAGDTGVQGGKTLVQYTSWPWLPILQFERYQDLFIE